MGNVRALLALDHVRLIHEQEGFWGVFNSATTAAVRGNLVPDFHLAAVLKQNGVRTLYTRDSDFRRFAFLTVKNPFVP